MSKLYNYIPEEKQKEIILTCLVSDREYQNINVRTVSKWLEQNGKQFFTQECHKETIQDEFYKPVDGEERDKWLNIWAGQLKDIADNMTAPTSRKGSGQILKEQLEFNGIKKPEQSTKPFVIEGLEIYAKTEDEAREIYNATVAKPI